MTNASRILLHAAIYLRQSYKPRGLNYLLWDDADAEAVRLLFTLKADLDG